MGIIPGRSYNTQFDGDDYAMRVSGRLSVTPLHCVVDMSDTPENINFIQRRVCPSSVVSRESMMELRELFLR